MPERISIDGIWYVREDSLPQPSKPPEDRWELLKPLCAEYGVDPHRAYAAVRRGELDARMPNGNRRGLRVRRSEFVRWHEDGWLARRE